jgi:hypothetical protein
MAVVYMSEMAGASRDMIEAVTKEMDVESNPPTGMLIHTASELPGGGIRIIDVWDSRESHQAFARDRLGPALGKIAQQLGVDMSTMPAASEEYVDVFDVKHGA